MRLPRKDIIATLLVAAAVGLYALWLADATLPGLNSTRATGVTVLVLGFVASAAAVVPGFDRLMHGNKIYLGVTAILGLVALGAGLVMLVSADEVALAVLVAAMVVLWAISTVHHMMLAGAEPATEHDRPLTTAGR